MPARKKKSDRKASPPRRTLEELIAEGVRLREHGDRVRKSMRELAAAIETARVEAAFARARAEHSRND